MIPKLIKNRYELKHELNGLPINLNLIYYECYNNVIT